MFLAQPQAAFRAGPVRWSAGPAPLDRRIAHAVAAYGGAADEPRGVHDTRCSPQHLDHTRKSLLTTFSDPFESFHPPAFGSWSGCDP
jgi:hypothetical protein